MKCSPKTMLKIGVAIAALLAGGYLFFPQSRPFIIGVAPFALFAICPLSMIFCMKGMGKDKNHIDSCTSCAEEDHKKHTQIS